MRVLEELLLPCAAMVLLASIWTATTAKCLRQEAKASEVLPPIGAPQGWVLDKGTTPEHAAAPSAHRDGQ